VLAPGDRFCAACGGPLTPSDVAAAAPAWGWRQVGLGLLLSPLAFVAALIPVFPFALIFDSDSDAFYGIASGLTAIFYLGLAAIAAWVAFVRHNGGDWTRGWGALGFRRPNWSTVRWGAFALLGAWGAAFAYGGVIEAFDVDSLKASCDAQVPNRIRENAWLLGVTGVTAVVFAPLGEEIFFRGFALRGLARSFGAVVAVIVSGTLFGFAHLLGGFELLKVLPIFVPIGIFFGIAAWRSGNILSSMGAHFIFNLASILAIASTTCEP
jgi:membrane protease YdiL (CAAX protease family)